MTDVRAGDPGAGRKPVDQDRSAEGEEHWDNDPEEMMRAALRAALGVLERYRGPEPEAKADEQDVEGSGPFGF